MGHKSYQDRSEEAEALQIASQSEGCPVCTVVLERIARSMDTWSYEGFTDVGHRQQVIRARGFCPLHTWQLAQRNNAFQLGVVYENILSDLLEELEDEQEQIPAKKSGRNWQREIKQLLQPGSAPIPAPHHLYEQCTFCKLQASTEKRLVERLVGLLQSEKEMPTVLSQSTGLCRLHFIQAMQYAETHAPEQRHTLISCQRTCIERVLGEIRELVRKHDYRFSQEAHGEEMTSWRRAAKLCAGNPGIRS
jgi:hypothetical protein